MLKREDESFSIPLDEVAMLQAHYVDNTITSTLPF